MRHSLQRQFAAAVVLALSVLVASTSARAAQLPVGFVETVVATGLANPTAMEFAPDGRLFVAEQGGRLRVIKNGVLLATPFVTLTVNASGERGLLGVAFDPDFATNHFVYVYYTATDARRCTTASAASPPNGDVAVGRQRDGASSTSTTSSSATNHNGGAIHFGPDGKLYVAVGDNANGANAQTLDQPARQDAAHQRRRHDPDRQPVLQPRPPATTARSGRSGLRNPFTFAFQPGTGRMFINDVGQNTWEEINDGVAGANYGWPSTEGADRQSATSRSAVYAYQHGAGTATRLRHHRRRVLQPGDRAVSRRATSATTSSPTTAAAGSACSTRRTATRRRRSPPASSSPVDLEGRPPTAASTTSRAAADARPAWSRCHYGDARRRASPRSRPARRCRSGSRRPSPSPRRARRR